MRYPPPPIIQAVVKEEVVEVISISSDSDEDQGPPNVPAILLQPWPEWAGVELSAGEIMFNRNMYYTATLGETLYLEWLNSLVASDTDSDNE
jgi:hypothetical protein